MPEVFLALGSNLNDRTHYLRKAVDLLHYTGNIVLVAPLYRSSAYGYRQQPAFFNSALLLNTKMEPIMLLDELKRIEKQIGRKKRIRWGPREIDLDIIFYNRIIMETERLTIPHPDFHNRRFVLKPLADIAPNFQSPTHRKTIAELLDMCNDKTRTGLIATNWYFDGIKI